MKPFHFNAYVFYQQFRIFPFLWRCVITEWKPTLNVAVARQQLHFRASRKKKKQRYSFVLSFFLSTRCATDRNGGRETAKIRLLLFCFFLTLIIVVVIGAGCCCCCCCFSSFGREMVLLLVSLSLTQKVGPFPRRSDGGRWQRKLLIFSARFKAAEWLIRIDRSINRAPPK